jgi:hypothetical protein
MEQLKKWKEEDNQEKMQEANESAGNCILCKRVWMKFWSMLRD